MESEIKLNGTVLAENDAAGTEEDPITSLIRAKYTDATGKIHLAMLQTLLSCVTDNSGKRLDRIIEELQEAVGTGGKPVTEIINTEIDKKVGSLSDLPTENKANVVASLDELKQGIDKKWQFVPKASETTENPETFETGCVYSVEGTLSTENGHPYNAEWTHITYLIYGDSQRSGDGYKNIIAIDYSGRMFVKSQGWNSWSKWIALQNGLDIAKAGLANRNLSSTEWGSIEKTADLPVTFFTAWGAYDELPWQYGSGVIVPGLDLHVKFIHYIAAWNNSTRKWLGIMRFTDDTTYNIYWEEVPYGKSYVDVSNIDEIVEPGVYVVPSTVSIMPPPTLNWGNESFIWAILIVEKTTKYGEWIVQTLKIAGSKKGVVTLHRMQTNNEGWSDWEQIIDTNVISGIVSNPNIFINPNFRINQRGKSVYTLAEYTADRWKVDREATIKVENGHIEVSAECSLFQALENYQDLLGKTMTFSASTNKGFAKGTIVVNDGHEYFYADDNFQLYHHEKWFGIYSVTGVVVYWMKLELGVIATQFVTPNPVEELVKCRRYYERGRSAWSLPLDPLIPDFYQGVNFEVEKRRLPTVTFTDENGNESGKAYDVYGNPVGIRDLFADPYGIKHIILDAALENINKSVNYHFAADAEIY